MNTVVLIVIFEAFLATPEGTLQAGATRHEIGMQSTLAECEANKVMGGNAVAPIFMPAIEHFWNGMAAQMKDKPTVLIHRRQFCAPWQGKSVPAN